MCGIIGYSGNLEAGPVILSGLKQLEYRGYDSAGMALLTESNELYLVKKVGRVAALEKEIDPSILSHCGIGHTRWATHGGVTDTNAHPHCAGKVVLLHNGIIENYHTLQKQFGFAQTAVSQTDTEVAAQLIDYYYNRCKNPQQAICRAVDLLEGSYAFCILFTDVPGKVFCIRSVSPLVAASCEQGCFVASDLTALIAYANRYFVLPEHTLLCLDRTGMTLTDLQGNPVDPDYLEVSWNIESAQKGGYPHYMLKEIYEQPEAFNRTVTPRIRNGLPDFSEEKIPDSLLQSFHKIRIVACGTALYAGMVGRSLLERKGKIPVEVSIASEFRYDPPVIDDKTLVLIISQSGETIDSLAALRLAKQLGATVISVINVKGSSIARESDYVIYTHAGPEISVASTKAYMVQISVLYLLAARIFLARGILTPEEVRTFIGNLGNAEKSISSVLEQRAEQIRHLAEKLAHCAHAFYIGRGMDYAFSMEGALKLKEITYIHAEAYAAGELKHGTISLIEEGIPVVAIATQDSIFNKTISNVREVKARGAFVILITKEGVHAAKDFCDIQIEIPQVDDFFTVFPIAVVLQLLAYYTAYVKGYDMDKPRNLAKSVTVE